MKEGGSPAPASPYRGVPTAPITQPPSPERDYSNPRYFTNDEKRRGKKVDMVIMSKNIQPGF